MLIRYLPYPLWDRLHRESDRHVLKGADAVEYVLPMFPLGTPLLPGRLLPLRIFEPRYVALLRQCLEQDSPEFGVVLIERGFEVGGGDHRAMIGTVAGILEAIPRPTGDFGVISYGRRRFQVTEWLPDDPHPWAKVVDWPDADESEMDTGDPKGEYRRAVSSVVERLRSILHLIDPEAREREMLERLVESVETSAPTQVTFSLSSLVPFGAADQYRLLRSAGVRDRLTVMMELFDDLEAIINFQRSEDPFD